MSLENNLGGSCHQNQDQNLTNDIKCESEKDFVIQLQNDNFAFISTIEPKCFEDAFGDENRTMAMHLEIDQLTRKMYGN